MHSTFVGLIVLFCTFGGVILGMWLRNILPTHHLEGDSKDTVKVGIGLVASMTALVLGLVTASAKNSFDTVDAELKQTAAQLVALDRTLARYGSETAGIRSEFKKLIGARIEALWPSSSEKSVDLDPMHSNVGVAAEKFAESVRSLNPSTDAQRSLQSRAMDQLETILQSRWQVLAANQNSVPAPFLAIILFWLTITFTSFGMLAPRNGTVFAVLFVCALSVASAIFLILELDSPLNGVLKISPEPLQRAYEHINQ